MDGLDTPIDNDDEFNTCLTLEDDLIGYSSRSLIARKSKKFKPNDSDYVQADNLRSDLYNYLTNKDFMECCRCRNGTSGQQIPAAKQV